MTTLKDLQTAMSAQIRDRPLFEQAHSSALDWMGAVPEQTVSPDRRAIAANSDVSTALDPAAGSGGQMADRRLGPEHTYWSDTHLHKETSMLSYTFEKLDAFATERSSGNPAAMILLARPEDIKPKTMQRIARELKGYVSETGFVWPARDADFELRYYSSEQEVGFCGHATVAIMHRLISSHGGLQDRKELRIRTRDSELRVINRVQSENLVYIFAPSPGFLSPDLEHPAIAAALDLPVADIDTGQPPVAIDLGQKILLVPLASAEACRSLAPDYQRLRKFCLGHDIQIITVYAITDNENEMQLSTRVFPPVYGYLEDPATGSGNAALGYRLLRDGRWDGTPLTIRQGPDQESPNLVYLSTSGDTVLIGGSAVCRLSGTYYLP